MTFSDFAQTLQHLEATPSRLEMTKQLAELFARLQGPEITWACYLMQGQLVPPYESLDFNLSVKMLERALARLLPDPGGAPTTTNLFGESEVPPTNLAQVDAEYKKVGDLGLVAQDILGREADRGANPGSNRGADPASDGRAKRVSPVTHLTIAEVYERLVAVARDSGEGSQERKVEGMVDLLGQSDPLSAKFMVRIVLGKLRLGFSTMTMLDALSWAKTGSKAENNDLELAYQKKADLGKLARAYLETDTDQKRHQNLARYAVEAGVPVVPALCQRLNSSAEIIAKMGEVFAESKYDGLRVQIHIFQDSAGQRRLRAFTRNLEDVSEMFPELDQALTQFKCQSCVVDSEAIGFDPQTGQLVEFQKTITRKRKHDITATALTVPIRFYIFDILELNGESLIDKPLRERKELLNNLFDNNEVFLKTEYLLTSDAIELHRFHETQLAAGLEGAVMKKSDSSYVGGRKGWNWVKIKEEEGSRGKLSDTLDVVVMGYYYGRGKRNQFGLGAVLVGIMGSDGQIKTVAKIGTGLSDEQLRQMKQVCAENQASERPVAYDVHKNLLPDIWVSPQVVIEVAADEITKSPTHTAGFALRFPRMIRFRDDKTWEQITTTTELSAISHQPQHAT